MDDDQLADIHRLAARWKGTHRTETEAAVDALLDEVSRLRRQARDDAVAYVQGVDTERLRRDYDLMVDQAQGLANLVQSLAAELSTYGVAATKAIAGVTCVCQTWTKAAATAGGHHPRCPVITTALSPLSVEDADITRLTAEVKREGAKHGS